MHPTRRRVEKIVMAVDEVNMRRTSSEMMQKFNEQKTLLLDHCAQYDAGKLFYAYPISTVLRVLLKDSSKKCTSLLTALGIKERLKFMDTSLPKGCIAGWEINDAHNLTVMEHSIYAGLASKTLTGSGDNVRVSLRPLFQHPNQPRWIDFDSWYNQEVLDDGTHKMSRKNIIENFAEKEGGCHVDPESTPEQATFVQPTSLKIQVNGYIMDFNPAPVYVSLRQIAWEVLETLK